MKVLLWKIGALGDVLMTTPLVRQLRARLPQARIDYLTGRGFASMLADNPHLDQVLTFDEHVLYGPQVQRVPEVLRLLRGYDAVYVLDKHWIFTWLAALARIPVRIGFRRRAAEGWPLTHAVPYGAVRHEIDCYLDLLDAAGLGADRTDVALDAPALEGMAPAVADAEAATVLVNAGGRNAHEDSTVRRMPETLFAELVQACAERGPVLFLGSAAERPLYAAYESDRCVNLCGRTSLGSAAATLRQAARVVTTDTGLMHLAAAVNPRVTAVFGPTHPLRKCPPGANWVWTDEAQYDPRYELFGTVPRGRYFTGLCAQDLLGAAQPSPLGRSR
ncbi:glycosyltransferase family 9 protein [Ramlibacter algicola]|uniref:Glycosyltransferase family 9 protein n=1 Tax=Ramlibacter algicola TaxID=2795217 RepID=A0A934PXP4_9BURK|nr:glycosyltransferase family 9 protein [Ramlibacter algicola]MBK0391273.1 glycosyltransferase family 9 protein [Ramlibacter algicola]